MRCSEPCPVPVSTALPEIFGIIVVLVIVMLVFEPIVRYYFCRSFVPWSERWLERIADVWTRYEEYWDPDAPAKANAPEDV